MESLLPNKGGWSAWSRCWIGSLQMESPLQMESLYDWVVEHARGGDS